jgi:hypothetical protein
MAVRIWFHTTRRAYLAPGFAGQRCFWDGNLIHMLSWSVDRYLFSNPRLCFLATQIDVAKLYQFESARLRIVSHMSTWALILSFTLVLAVPLLARDKTDVLVMKNGDRMTCEIKGLDAGVLYVSYDYIDGTVLVDWSKVARLESKQLFLVKTEDGSVYTGTLRTPETAASQPVTIQVVKTPEQEVAINQFQIVQMIATSEKFWQRFSGEISFGSIYSKGNQSTQYTLGSQAAYIRERWSAKASFDSNLSSSTGDNVSTRNSFNLLALHLLPWNNWFYSGLGGFLQSSEQGITLQSTLGGGVGRYLKNTDRASISVLAGVAWQRTNYEQSIVPSSEQNTAAAMIYTEARFFKFSKTNFNVTAALLPVVSDPGRVRFNTNMSYYIKLVSNLKWNVSFYGNWDNRPPPGFSGSDYGSSSGLSWTFGLK